MAMKHVPDAKLVLVGSGDVEEDLKDLAARMEVEERVLFTGRVGADVLASYTLQADLGISLERDEGLNYRYALPNKLFDYIQAEVPVLVSDLPEMSAIVRKYDIGLVSDADDPLVLARLFHEGLHDGKKIKTWRANLKKAAGILCWEHEEHTLLELYRKAIENS
jgi:glycosyltransferase involved in cell wall biosynthesis